MVVSGLLLASTGRREICACYPRFADHVLTGAVDFPEKLIHTKIQNPQYRQGSDTPDPLLGPLSAWQDRTVTR